MDLYCAPWIVLMVTFGVLLIRAKLRSERKDTAAGDVRKRIPVRREVPEWEDPPSLRGSFRYPDEY